MEQTELLKQALKKIENNLMHICVNIERKTKESRNVLDITRNNNNRLVYG